MNPIKFWCVILKRRIKRFLTNEILSNSEIKSLNDHVNFLRYSEARHGSREILLEDFGEWMSQNLGGSEKHKQQLRENPTFWARFYKDMGYYDIARWIEKGYI